MGNEWGPQAKITFADLVKVHVFGPVRLVLQDSQRMCFILDIVLNHIRPVHSLSDLSKVKPFNDTRYLHLLNMSGMSFDKYLDPS